MKVLVFYDDSGRIVSYQTKDNFDEGYNYLIEDFKENRQILGIDVQNRQIIWGIQKKWNKLNES